MTALNLFCQGERAFMLTDGAVTDLNGLLISKQPKALLLENARVAICWTGFAPMPSGGFNAAATDAGARVKAAILAQGVDAEHADQNAIMAAMPGALRAMHIENMRTMPGATVEMMSLTIGVALWNEQRGPMVIIGQTETAAGVPAYTFIRVRHYISTDQGDDTESFVDKALGRSADLSDPRSFNARYDGLELLEAQRCVRTSFSGSYHYGVGGQAVMVEVSSLGISDTVLRLWPDQEGQPIRPTLRSQRPDKDYTAGTTVYRSRFGVIGDHVLHALYPSMNRRRRCTENSGAGSYSPTT